MKKKIFAILFLSFLVYNFSFASSGEVLVKMVSPSPVWVGQKTKLTFQLLDKETGKSLSASSLEVAHEKLMHVVGLRRDMNEFFHIHPVVTDQVGGVFEVEYAFQKPGEYHIWAEVQQAGKAKTFFGGKVQVSGAGLKEEKKIYDAKMVSAGPYHAAISYPENIVAGQSVQISVDAHTQDGRELALDNWLGAPMHINIFSEDLSTTIHAHPANHSHTSTVNTQAQTSVTQSDGSHNGHMAGHGVQFDVVFPKPGLYKVFAQFRPSEDKDLRPDETRVGAFWINVKENVTLKNHGLSRKVIAIGICAVLLLGLVLLVQIKRHRSKKDFSSSDPDANPN